MLRDVSLVLHGGHATDTPSSCIPALPAAPSSDLRPSKVGARYASAARSTNAEL